MRDRAMPDPHYSPASCDWFLDSPKESEADRRYRSRAAQRRLYEYDVSSAVAGAMTWGAGWMAGRQMSWRLRNRVAELEREAGKRPDWTVCQERGRYREDRRPVRHLRTSRPPGQRHVVGAAESPPVQPPTTERPAGHPRCMHWGA